MDYQQAMDKMHQLTKFGFNFGLERIKKLLELLGNPERDYPVIHIGGTNGKGSTSMMVASILSKAGLKVGLFTSPHLHSYTERIRINGAEISQKEFAQLLEEIVPLFAEMVQEGFEHPTEFEVNTAMALNYFSRQQVDVVVLEVGLGGAIDSTNVVDPLVAVITNVTMEHMEYLGETLEEIATVKAGIIKPRRPLLVADTKPEVLQVVHQVATQLAAPLYQVQNLVQVERTAGSLESQLVDLILPDNIRLTGVVLPLLGDYQLVNCATAVAVIHLLNMEYDYAISGETILEGLAQVSWPGRMELMSRDPQVLIDGAHNVAGVAALVSTLQRQFSYGRLILVLGMLADKERERAVALLAPLAHEIIITRPDSPRAGEWQQLAQMALHYCPRVSVVENPREAVDKALTVAKSDDLICITGSLYMIGGIREYLLVHKQKPCEKKDINR